MSNLTDFRKAKDEFFKTSQNSPLLAAQQKDFPGISYYDEDVTLRYRLDVKPFDVRNTATFETSTGESIEYVSWGKVKFTVCDTMSELTLFKNNDGEGFFLPFADSTTGNETYSGGRYLDVNVLANGQVLLDFNLAYNPYCAYNNQWSCPLTPSENHLTVPVRAGEKPPEQQCLN